MDYNQHQFQTDRIWVDNVLRGDKRAFAQIIKATEGLVGQIVFKMIVNPEDRKDIAQEVYLKVYQKLGTFRFQAKLSTWIGQIAYNTCLNHLERKKLILVALRDAGPDEMDRYGDSVNPLENQIEEQLLRKELTQLIERALDQLNPIYRTLITLYHQEELSYAEIGQIVQLPEGTVKNYLFRARKALKEQVIKAYTA